MSRTVETDDNISVAATKKRRGRPKAFGWMDGNPETKALNAVITEGASRRVALHRLYFIEAQAALHKAPGEPNPRYAWFDGPKPRFSVMVELGRVAVELGHDSARQLADMLVRDVANGLAPTTREAEHWLRHERLKALGQMIDRETRLRRSLRRLGYDLVDAERGNFYIRKEGAKVNETADLFGLDLAGVEQWIRERAKIGARG